MRWAQLGTGGRMAVVAAGAVQVGLLGAALVDLGRREAGAVNGPRWAWVLASFVNFVGPIAYFSFGRRRDVPGRAVTAPTREL